jgi:hypothetical protein
MVMKGWQVMEWALDAEVDRPADRLVLVAYARHRNHRTGLAWPSIETLKRGTLCDRKTIMAARQRLVNRNYLQRAGRIGRHGVDRYYVRCPENETSSDVDNSSSASRNRDCDHIVDVPETEDRRPENGTHRHPKNGTALSNPTIEPNQQPGGAARGGAKALPNGWWRSEATILHAGRLLGLEARRGESLVDFKGRVELKATEGAAA